MLRLRHIWWLSYVILQIYYWVALSTVRVIVSRLKTRLTPEERSGKYACWMRGDRFHKHWYQPLIAATVIFPFWAYTLMLFAGTQLLLVHMIYPFIQNGQSSGLSNWFRAVLKRVLRFLSWVELRCCGVTRLEEYEVMNYNFDFPLSEASQRVKVQPLVRYESSPSAEPRNYVSNHVSFVDILLYIALIYPSFCSKAGVCKVPLVGPTAKALDCIFLERGSKRSREQVMRAIHARQTRLWKLNASLLYHRERGFMGKLLEKYVEYFQLLEQQEFETKSVNQRTHSQTPTPATRASPESSPPWTPLPSSATAGAPARATATAAVSSPHSLHPPISFDATNSLMIFPEGTTSNGRSLLAFKRGAFAGLKPVHPLLLVYDSPAFDASYEIIPIIWLWPVLAGGPEGITAKIYWMKELGPSVDMVVNQSVTHFAQHVRECMGKVLSAIKPSTLLTDGNIANADLSSKKECIAKLFH